MVVNDQLLRNIVNLLETKYKKPLDGVSPEILHHISAFENLNNLTKRLAIEDDESLAEIDKSNVITKKLRRKDFFQ